MRRALSSRRQNLRSRLPRRRPNSSSRPEKPPAKRRPRQRSRRKFHGFRPRKGCSDHWDLRADGPVRWDGGKDFNKGPRSGALVPPGEYDRTYDHCRPDQFAETRGDADPTSHADPAGMEERFQAVESALHELSQVDVALNRIDAIHGSWRHCARPPRACPKSKK